MVAGGDIPGFEASVQIYDIASGTWRLSDQFLPHYLRESEVVQYGDTFLIVGGHDGDMYSDTSDEILQFNPDDETWLVREERLSSPRAGAYVAFVDSDMYGC